MGQISTNVGLMFKMSASLYLLGGNLTLINLFEAKFFVYMQYTTIVLKPVQHDFFFYFNFVNLLHFVVSSVVGVH